jgi:NAD(P)-dependent dehydrogenase (short-subunit alcohol dehydrogenase family)
MASERKLEGRKVLITGAASGMGRAIAELFKAEGASLALLDINQAGVTAAAEELGAFGAGCDVTDRDEVDRLTMQAGERLGGLDGLVNAAGILEIAPFAELTHESWDRMLAVNLTGPFNLTKAALPLLAKAKVATIVNIASTSALMPMPGTAGYSTSKAGLAMLTKCLGMDLGPAIRVNCICPGVIETEMTRYLWENPEHKARAAERVALNRLGSTADVAKAALFLSCADSAFTTGAAIPVDGGFAWR